MVELEIDGKKIEAPEGSMVIQAAQRLGTYIPHFCYHKKLTIAANCRMCLVEVEKMPKAVPACATPVANGMVVKTRSEKAIAAQQSVMEFLLINHPLDCPICDQGGECQLQDLAVGYGKSQARYTEEKRVVFHKNAGPLVAMEEMTRCIHCTRCVRFGKEIGGIMELGMIGRGEHAEITSFIEQSVDSELSGNMIDLCPVGALTSKPFRYSARNWELSRRRSISPHDSMGANLIIQVKLDRVMRVLPYENELLNECWLSDKDRFSYEALNSEARLTRPALADPDQKHESNTWRMTNWQEALQTVADRLRTILREHGTDAVAILASPHSTLEELFLLKRLAVELGTQNIDFRLRQTDFRTPLLGAPWLGMPIEALSTLDRALVIGAFLDKDHPLFAARLRQAVKNGASLHLLQATDDDAHISGAQCLVAAPSAWVEKLSEIIAAVATTKGIAIPYAVGEKIPSPQACAIAASLMSGERCAILLGNMVVSHPDFSILHAYAQWIAEHTNATLGFLTEAANTVGAHLVQAMPQSGNFNAVEAFQHPRRAYILFNVEPAFDVAYPAQAREALPQADLVVHLSAFKPHIDDVGSMDVLLPISPFTETAGSFINAQGMLQDFNGVVRPLGETRPGWKVLRALGSFLNLPGFEYDSAEAVRAAALQEIGPDIAQELSNITEAPLSSSQEVRLCSTHCERLADMPIYHADPLVRNASSLQATKTAKRAAVASLPPKLFAQLGLKEGETVRIQQGQRSTVMPAICDERLSESVVRVPAGTSYAASLESLFGAVEVSCAGNLVNNLDCQGKETQ